MSPLSFRGDICLLNRLLWGESLFAACQSQTPLSRPVQPEPCVSMNITAPAPAASAFESTRDSPSSLWTWTGLPGPWNTDLRLKSTGQVQASLF